MKFAFSLAIAVTLAVSTANGAVDSSGGMAPLHVVGNEGEICIAIDLGGGAGMSFQALRWAEMGGVDRFDSVSLVCGDSSSPGKSPRELASWTVMPELSDGWCTIDLSEVYCADCEYLYVEFSVRPDGSSTSGAVDSRPGLGYWNDGRGERCFLGSAGDGWLRAHESIGVAAEILGAAPVASSTAKVRSGPAEVPDGLAADSEIHLTEIESVWPNPANPQATIRFSASKRGHYRVAVYDVRGRLVKTLVDGAQEPGDRIVQWQGRDSHGMDVTSGVYFIRLAGPDRVESRRVTLLK